MAKIAFSKLNLKPNTSVQSLIFNEQVIEVKQYLPINEKLQLIERVIETAHDENFNYSNPMKRQVLMDLEIIFTYTNLTFTDHQKESLEKLYDIVYSSGLLEAVKRTIPIEEYQSLVSGIELTTAAIYEYQHSVLGLLNVMKQDYGDMDQIVEKLQTSIKDPETLTLVKDVLTKMG